tara:strand:+ start:312 stop:1736 length:1425 start_codon:yes stop_codon:yes gene_type:complete
LKFQLYPVILSGGVGSRLWPLSRGMYPKQYHNLENNYSLLQNTYLRLKGINNLENPIIICNDEQRFIVAEQMRKIDVKPKSIILEPMGRNTAPAIALAALHALESNSDPFLLILSADHKIENPKEFRQTIEKSLIDAEKDSLITFGVVPNKPETGYGYIEANEVFSDNLISSSIKKFIEKPNKKLADQLFKDKRYLWNSGIFLFKASIILKELEKYEPELVNTCKNSLLKSKKDLDFIRLDKESFKSCADISIDIAVMERTNLGKVVPLKVGWSDLGSWNSIYEYSKKDKNGNSIKGNGIIKESKDCYLRSEGRLVVGFGLKDLFIIETKDAVLVAHKNYTQNIKNLVEYLSANNFKEATENKKVYRPWGLYESIADGKNWQVKRLEINPKGKLSLQMHNHRAEHWVIVAGKAKIEIEGKISILKTNESIFVPLGKKHRLTNPTEEVLVLIEVQSGTYLEEDDIVRFDDIYGRK